jgi:Leucine-rich repeat (LRR) protein
MKKTLLSFSSFLIMVIYSSGFTQESTTAKSSGFYFDTQNLSSVTELDLGYRDINAFPSEIFEMSNLQSLDLSNNYLTEVPKEIKNLQDLKVLKLNGNNIYELPSEISRLKFLKEIYLDYFIWQYRLDELKSLTDARIILIE